MFLWMIFFHMINIFGLCFKLCNVFLTVPDPSMLALMINPLLSGPI